MCITRSSRLGKSAEETDFSRENGGSLALRLGTISLLSDVPKREYM
jgi:hypothetical protein